MSVSNEKLFAVIRCGLGLESPVIPLSEEECTALHEIGKKQSIQSILYRGMKGMNVSSEQLRTADTARSRDMYDHVQREDAIRRIRSALDAAEIPYVLLKGAVLSHLYPSPEMRTSSDIDILVHEEDLDRAVTRIEGTTDFKTLKKAYHDVSLLSARVHLELHFTLKENAEKIDRQLSRAWEYAAATGEGSRYAFSPEFQIFHIIAHMSHHFLHGGLGVRPFLDLWLLRKNTSFDEEAVRSLCDECGILKFYEECCRLSDVWLGRAEHTETTAALEAFCLSGGVFGSARFKNAGRQREKRGWKYILGRVFPPPYQVREYYRDESGKKHVLTYYYIKRLTSWLGSGRREDLKKQVQTVLASDSGYLDKTEWLFKKLEL